jgi:hypothetical protein
MFEVDHMLRAHDQPRREIRDQRRGLRRGAGEHRRDLEQLFDRGRRPSACVEGDA